MHNIEHLNKNNPKEFWNKLRNLGPSKENLLPNKVYKNGVIVTDTGEVLDRWKSDFSSLYNPVINKNFDDVTNEVIMTKDALESETYINQKEQLNEEISVVEIQLASVRSVRIKKHQALIRFRTKL